MPNKVMMTFTFPNGTPTLSDVIRFYNLRREDLDERYGVIEIDPEDHLFSVMVDSSVANRLQPGSDANWQGPFSNPKIEPFGLNQG